jgi:hypothetical protein
VEDVDEVHKFIQEAISRALDMIAPFKSMCVRTQKSLYLAKYTLERMPQRDKAHGAAYRYLRNRCADMVKQDKRASNLSELAKVKGDPQALWELANQALGKNMPSLPASVVDASGLDTVGNEAAAVKCLKTYYVDKVLKLRERNKGCLPPPPSAWPKKSGYFTFKFANAGRVARVIKSIGSSEALGIDGIPISVYKKGVEIIAGPLAHLINRSLAMGVVPLAFKLAVVRPIYKGSGKNRCDPSSYRPVSILPAVSKVLEIVVKQDLEGYLREIDRLPTSQNVF